MELSKYIEQIIEAATIESMNSKTFNKNIVCMLYIKNIDNKIHVVDESQSTNKIELTMEIM